MIGSAIAMLLPQMEFGKQENASDGRADGQVNRLAGAAGRTTDSAKPVSGPDATQAQRDPPPR